MRERGYRRFSERISPPARLCTIEIAEWDPAREKPEIILTNTEYDYKVVVVTSDYTTAAVAHVSSIVQIEDQPTVSIERHLRLGYDPALQYALSLCQTWAGKTGDRMRKFPGFVLDPFTRSQVYGGTLHPQDEEQALARMRYIERINEAGIPIPVATIFKSFGE